MIARIRTEGLQRSRALALYRTLTDEIGARLTGSPAHVQAARWARDRFTEWGLANPHLEPYEFGRGWQLEHISVEMTEAALPCRSSHMPTHGRRQRRAW